MKSTMQVHFGLDSVHLVYLVCLVEPNKAGQDTRETSLPSRITRHSLWV